jgi:hypothetical protein
MRAFQLNSFAEKVNCLPESTISFPEVVFGKCPLRSLTESSDSPIEMERGCSDIQLD